MIEVILASHKSLAKGMKESLEFIAGPFPNVKVMEAYTHDKYNIEEEIEKLLDFDDKAIVITDVLGGSVNSAWMNYVINNKLTNRIKVITGMNLALVIEICTSINDNDFFEKIPDYINSAKEGIIDCNSKLGV